MGAPTSEVGYTSATNRRGDHEVYMDIWWRWRKTKNKKQNILELCLTVLILQYVFIAHTIGLPPLNLNTIKLYPIKHQVGCTEVNQAGYY
jgi:hypothetical protein